MQKLSIAFALLAFGCAKENKVDSTRIDCGDDAIKCIPCEAGELDCDGSSLIRCKDDGMGFALLHECDSIQLCVEGLAAEVADAGCAEPLCQANEVRCVGAVMQICAEGRDGFDLVECESVDACLRGMAAGRCAEVECSEDADCTGEDAACTRRVCREGMCGVANQPAETPCEIREVNGACDGAGACVPRAMDACTIGADCTGEDTDCSQRTCEAGECGRRDANAGTPCTLDELNGTCDGAGECVPEDECNRPEDCAGEDTQCRNRACLAGRCEIIDLTDGRACDVEGIPGACSGGQCVAVADCALPSDCPEALNACELRACLDDGLCGFEPRPAETPCDAGGFDGACDGAGRCVQTQFCRDDASCGGQIGDCQRSICNVELGRCVTRNLNGNCQIGRSEGVCFGGRCICEAQNHQNIALCDDTCVPTIDNPEHCGRCNRPCREDEVCNGAVCGCGEDHRECRNVCTDLTRQGNCGGCDRFCPDNARCVESSGCAGNHGIGCECNAGFEVCRTNTAPASDGLCMRPDTPEWVAAECRSGTACNGIRVEER